MKSGLTIEEQVLEVVGKILFGLEVNLDTIVLNASGIKDIVDYITKKKTPEEPKKEPKPEEKK